MFEFFLTRTNVKLIFLSAERTKDGNFWTPQFPEDLFLMGNFAQDVIKEEDYKFNRDEFRFNMYFTHKEYKMFFLKKDSCEYSMDDIVQMREKHQNFYLRNFPELRYLRLDDKLNNGNFTVEDLVDNYEFKYS